MIRISRLKKSFDGQSVLDGIDLDIQKGEVLCFLGPSGTGKSTLLRCLIGLERADEGLLYIDDAPPFDLHRVGHASLHRLRRSFFDGVSEPQPLRQQNGAGERTGTDGDGTADAP